MSHDAADSAHLIEQHSSGPFLFTSELWHDKTIHECRQAPRLRAMSSSATTDESDQKKPITPWGFRTKEEMFKVTNSMQYILKQQSLSVRMSHKVMNVHKKIF
jgi:hypothetical protein